MIVASAENHVYKCNFEEKNRGNNPPREQQQLEAANVAVKDEERNEQGDSVDADEVPVKRIQAGFLWKFWIKIKKWEGERS